MTDSNHEMEIKSFNFEQKDNDSCLLKIQDADKNVANLAKIIIKLKNDLNALENVSQTNQKKEKDLCFIKKQLVDLTEKHCNAVNEALELARQNNFDVENLEGLKIDINQNYIPTDVTELVNDSNKEIISPLVFINNGSKYKNRFVHDQQYETRLIKDHNQSNYSVKDGHKKEACCNNEDYSSMINNKNYKKQNKDLDPDFEKEAIRDDIMAMVGEMKLLHLQNRDLLNQLDRSKQQTCILSESIEKKPNFMVYKPEDGHCTGVVPKTIEIKSNMQDLISENSRLRDALKETKRDRCQIELAKKILNVSENQCANCMVMKDENKTKKLTEAFHKLLAHYKDKLTEIESLQSKLDEEKHNNRTYEDRLMISKTQVTQLEKQLFKQSLVPSDSPEVARQNDQYVIESLKHRLRKANEEFINLQSLFDFHMTDLEDKKSKYLEVLQINEEQKQNIEILCEQKRTIVKKYEIEFNRMNEHLQKRFAEVETLPVLLATALKDLENEKLAKKTLEDNYEYLKNKNDELKNSLGCEDNEKIENMRKNFEEENIQLKATIETLNDSLEESQRRYIERSHYLIQLKEQLEVVREESAIQVTKFKDIFEYQKLKYTDCIENLEQQLAKCRAIACAEFKKRDNIDENLKKQVEILKKSLNEAYKKISEFQDMKKYIELKIEGELCKVPCIVNSKCRDIK